MENDLRKEIENALEEDNLTLIKIILFGSRARKDHMPESDWDILVVLKEQIGPREKRDVWRKIYKALHRKFPRHSFDIIIKSEQEFESEKSVVNTISSEAVKEGILL
ncbi:nucleotidyltransferase domain-containing protein [Thermotoga sp.]|uniref:nucleotidyltransferase domain-containing protein n=1 Tax=Thermotoga sp. TaxID=28240 RepID=UPI0025CD5FB3|nr:nucleotidyltransferase domain-containing protein [Thermotoga sp.]MCD6551380.1 nucleotidyltransferase domain-containing protein [Thermotoga sp.]